MFYVITPTVTGEMAVSSTELGPVTREKVRSVMGHAKNLSNAQSQTRASFVDTVMVSHLYCHWSAGPSLAPARLGSCTLPWTPKVTSSAYLLTGNLLEVTLINYVLMQVFPSGNGR
jgi:hypothetical protein